MFAPLVLHTLAALLVATGATDEAWALWQEHQARAEGAPDPNWELIRGRIAQSWGLTASRDSAWARVDAAPALGRVSVANLLKLWRAAPPG